MLKLLGTVQCVSVDSTLVTGHASFGLGSVQLILRDYLSRSDYMCKRSQTSHTLGGLDHGLPIYATAPALDCGLWSELVHFSDPEIVDHYPAGIGCHPDP